MCERERERDHVPGTREPPSAHRWRCWPLPRPGTSSRTSAQPKPCYTASRSAPNEPREKIHRLQICVDEELIFAIFVMNFIDSKRLERKGVVMVARIKQMGRDKK